MSRKILVLASGGLDSTTVAYFARAEGYEVHLLHVVYNQRHAVETYCAFEIAKALNVPLYAINLPLWTINDTALVDNSVPVEHQAYVPEHMSTYVPARNTVFAAVAMSFMEHLKIPALGLGIHHTETYVDTSPEWAQAFGQLMCVGLELSVFSGMEIDLFVPFVSATKADIVKKAMELEVPISMTHSCYDPLMEKVDGWTTWYSCGKCATCQDRKQAFEEAGFGDISHLTQIRTVDKELAKLQQCTWEGGRAT